jgi:hypothetical protein
MSTITVNPVIYEVTVSGITGGIGATSLDQLTDVSVTSATTGYTLIHDGTQFVSQPGTGTFAAATHTHAQSDITGLTTFVAETGTNFGDVNDAIDAIGVIGTAGYLDVPASGNASAGQVVKGTDTRLTDARTAVAHTHPASAISDSTSPGRAVLTAATAADQRTALGLGSIATFSSGVYSLTSHTHDAAAIVTGQFTPTQVATGATGSTLCIGNDARLSDSRAPNGTATGDLYGSFPSPNVGKLRGTTISATSPSDGQVLTYVAGSTSWTPTTIAASGDLSGSYPAPAVVKLRGNALAVATPTNGQVLTWVSSTSSWTPAGAPAAAISYATNTAAATVSVSTTGYSLIGSRLSLAAGTWLVNSTITVSHTTSTDLTGFRIASNDATPVVYASTEARTVASGDNMSVSMSTIIVLAATKSIGHEARAVTAGTTVQIQTSAANGTSPYATQINAIRIA